MADPDPDGSGPGQSTSPDRPRPGRLPTVDHVVSVGSGKDGLGKSTAAGLLDADIYGPSPLGDSLAAVRETRRSGPRPLPTVAADGAAPGGARA